MDKNNFPTELSPGLVLKRGWKIIRKLSDGGMGRVYEAVQIELGRVRALKQTFYCNQDELDWFKHEAQILANLDHNCLPKVDELFEENGSYFYAMEFIRGPSLKERLASQGSIPTEAVLKWATRLLELLHYLHTLPEPVIHKDIKPDNIRIQGDNIFQRINLIRYIEGHGCELVREGSKHSIYANRAAKTIPTVPRHAQLSIFTARKICQDFQIPAIQKA
jgi:serine/threonine protein kinase